jgi:sRNA-binding protein
MTVIPYRPPIELAEAVADEMVERWPDIFAWPPRPLAVGLGPVILAALATTPPHGPPWTTMTYQTLEQAVCCVLEAWTQTPLYLARTRAGAPRIGLDGSQVGKVLKDEEQWARDRFKTLLFERFPWGGPPGRLGRWAGL